MPLHEGSNNEEKEASTYAIVQAELCEDIQCVAVVTADHNIILFSFDGLEQNKQVFNMIKVNIWQPCTQGLDPSDQDPWYEIERMW